jgi:dihydroxyacetone kinase-like protein
MQSFLNKDGGTVVEALIQTIKENAALLSDLDGAIGDGDHGINMKKGFTLCAERIAGKSLGMSDSLSTLGKILIGEIGGAMGPLYGTFFREMAKASVEKQSIDASVFQSMLEKANDGIVGLGNAHVGDKTLLDTLVPAREAFGAAVQSGKTFSEALTAMADAAEKGKESTRDLVARTGRASRLGERSKGFLDAGAVSCWLILASMARSMSTLLLRS